ncbi:hypothetical protein IAR50_003356 [Cryptococcus sp. DSM 104548]
MSSNARDTASAPAQNPNAGGASNASSSGDRPQTPYNLSTTNNTNSTTGNTDPFSPGSQASNSPASIFSRVAFSPTATRRRPNDRGRSMSTATAITEPDHDQQQAQHNANIQNMVQQGHFNPANEEEEVQDDMADYMDDMFGPDNNDQEGQGVGPRRSSQ